MTQVSLWQLKDRIMMLPLRTDRWRSVSIKCAKRAAELRPLWIKTTVKFVVTSFMTYAILGVYAMVLFLAHFVLYENRAEMIETGEFVLVQTINPVTVICIVIAALATIALIYASVLENANEARRYLASKGLKWF